MLCLIYEADHSKNHHLKNIKTIRNVFYIKTNAKMSKNQHVTNKFTDFLWQGVIESLSTLYLNVL